MATQHRSHWLHNYKEASEQMYMYLDYKHVSYTESQLSNNYLS